MAQYTLTVNLAPRWIKQWNSPTSDMKLCLALGMVTGGGTAPKFNVIAATVGTGDLSDKVTFSWQETYEIDATKQQFQGGMQVDTSSTALPIVYGQGYFLPGGWDGEGEVNTDPNAPATGFAFEIPPNTIASAVVYKPVAVDEDNDDPSMKPFYVSHDGPLPYGTEILEPVIQARVWWQSNTQSATMIDKYTSNVYTVDFSSPTPTTSKNCYFDKHGSWGDGTLPSIKN